MQALAVQKVICCMPRAQESNQSNRFPPTDQAGQLNRKRESSIQFQFPLQIHRIVRWFPKFLESCLPTSRATHSQCIADDKFLIFKS